MFLINGQNLFHCLEVASFCQVDVEFNLLQVLRVSPELLKLHSIDGERFSKEYYIKW